MAALQRLRQRERCNRRLAHTRPHTSGGGAAERQGRGDEGRDGLQRRSRSPSIGARIGGLLQYHAQAGGQAAGQGGTQQVLCLAQRGAANAVADARLPRGVPTVSERASERSSIESTKRRDDTRLGCLLGYSKCLAARALFFVHCTILQSSFPHSATHLCPRNGLRDTSARCRHTPPATSCDARVLQLRWRAGLCRRPRPQQGAVQGEGGV